MFYSFTIALKEINRIVNVNIPLVLGVLEGRGSRTPKRFNVGSHVALYNLFSLEEDCLTKIISRETIGLSVHDDKYWHHGFFLPTADPY